MYQAGRLQYKDYQFAVLDIRNAKLFKLTKKTKVDEIKDTLELEADYWKKYQERIQH